MIKLLDLLTRAELLLCPEEDKKALNSYKMIAELKKISDKFPDLDKESIGDFYSRQACSLWDNDQSDCISFISKYLEQITPETNKENMSTLVIGFIAAWINSDIQHIKVEELVKKTIKHNLLKYPLDMPVNEYFSVTNKKANHRPKKDVFEFFDTLMFYVQIKNVKGTSRVLNISERSVRYHLRQLVGEGKDFKLLIDKKFKWHDKIQEIYNLWVDKKEETQIGEK